MTSTVLQYVDDIVICSSSLEECHKDSITVLKMLAESGHKQYCKDQVKYLGGVLQKGTRGISALQVEGVSKAPKPTTVRQMMTFWGMRGYSSDWIEGYSTIVAPLRAMIKETGAGNLQGVLHWMTDACTGFETMLLEQAPAANKTPGAQ